MPNARGSKHLKSRGLYLLSKLELCLLTVINIHPPPFNYLCTYNFRMMNLNQQKTNSMNSTRHTWKPNQTDLMIGSLMNSNRNFNCKITTNELWTNEEEQSHPTNYNYKLQK